MLGLAGNSARVTADANVLVYDEAVLQGALQTVGGIGFCAARTLVAATGLEPLDQPEAKPRHCHHHTGPADTNHPVRLLV